MTYCYVPAARFLREFRNTLIKSYNDIVYNEHPSSYIDMSINRSPNLKKLYVPQNGLTKRVISDFLPDSVPTTSSLSSSHLFNNVSTGPSYVRIKYLSLIMVMMYVVRLTRWYPTGYIVSGHEIPTADWRGLLQCSSRLRQPESNK